MTFHEKLRITGALVFFLFALGAVDALLTHPTSPHLAVVTPPTDSDPTPAPSPTPSPSPTPIPTPVVPRNTGPNVLSVINQQGIISSDSNEALFLEQIITDGTSEVHTKALLKANDRIGSISWVSSPRVKIFYLALKEALHTSFTPAVTDLIDETQRREEKPPRNFLTFFDPGISEERFAFVRVKENLYEFRIVQGQEDSIFALIDALTE